MKRFAHFFEWDTRSACHADKGYPAENFTPIAALIASCAGAFDKSLPLKKVQRRDGDACPFCYFADT